MSRYSPSVLPEVPDATANFATRFAQTLARNQKEKEEGVAAGDAHTSSVVNDILKGLRMGKAPAGAPAATPDQAYADPVGNRYAAPSDAGVTFNPSPAPLAKGAPKIGDGLAEALGVGSAGLGAPEATPATKDMQRALGASGESLADVMAGKTSPDLAPGSGGPPAAPYSARKMPPSIDARGGGIAGTMVAGAFDPVTGGFASAHGLPEGADRYVQIDPQHYVDTLGGSQLMQAMLRADIGNNMLDRRLATARDIATDRTATTRAVAAGRDATRTSEGDANRAARFAQIKETADLAAQRQQAHDKATGARSRAMTGNADAAWKKAAAAGIMQEHDGSLDDAEDFLKTDPLAKEYRDRGLSNADLYTAAGAFHGHEVDQAERQLGSRTPARAAEATSETRTRVLEAKLSDHDLYNKKRDEGLDPKAAEAYVRKRGRTKAAASDSTPPAPANP